jgi:transcriptional regulator with XRE-family HTH domain
MLCMNASATELRSYIQQYLDRRGWTMRRLAEEAGISHSTVSRLMRGEIESSPETLAAIAKVMGVDAAFLMRLAGVPLPTPAKDRHPTAEYISQRLDDLPSYYRELAIEAVAGVVDSFSRVAHGEPANGANGTPILPPVREKENAQSAEAELSEIEQAEIAKDQAAEIIARMLDYAEELNLQPAIVTVGGEQMEQVLRAAGGTKKDEKEEKSIIDQAKAFWESLSPDMRDRVEARRTGRPKPRD